MTSQKDAREQAEVFQPSGKSHQEKERILDNIRARVISNERAFSGLLTFIKHEVVKDTHPWFDTQVAWTDGDKMYFADRYFSQDTPILSAILLHETFHVIFRHVIRGRNRIGHLFNVACFKPEEIIITSKGPKQIKDLGLGEEVLYGGKVNAVMSKEYNNLLYNIEPMGCLNTEATKEHPFYVATKKRNKEGFYYEYSWVNAEDLNVKRHKLCIPKLQIINKTILNLDKFKVIKKPSDQNRTSNFLKHGLVITNDLLYAMGYYVAEGSLNNSKKEGFNYALGPSDLAKKDRIVNYFTSIGYKPKFEQTGDNTYRLAIYSSILAKAFTEWFGRGAENKQIPYWLLHLPNNLTASFIKGYFDGDGYRKGNKLSAWTKSKTLAGQLQLLFAKHNKFLNISFVERNNANRKIKDSIITCNQTGYLLTYIKSKVFLKTLNNNIIKSSSQRWVNTDKYILIPLKNVTNRYYEGRVYNIETEKHEYLVSNIIVHNCDAIINDSIGYKQDISGSSSTLSSKYAYLDKQHCISLDSLFEELNIPQKERHPVSYWTAESLYKLLLDKLKKDLEEEVKNQEEKGKDQKDEKGGSQNNQESSSDNSEENDGSGSSSKNGSSSSPSKSSNSSSKRGGSSSNKSNSELGKLEQQIEDLMNRLRKKHKMFAGDDMVEGAPKDPTVEQMENAIWTERFNRAKSQGTGTAGVLGKINPDVYKSVTPWEKQLRKFLVKSCMPYTETSYTRPNRRMSALTTGYKGNKIYIPGTLPKKGIDKIVVVVDTSGSCFNNEEQNMFATEIDAIQKSTNSEVYLIYADTEVTAEYKINPQEGQTLRDKLNSGVIKAQGGGGTNMTIPILYAKEKYHPILTIVATDGCC